MLLVRQLVSSSRSRLPRPKAFDLSNESAETVRLLVEHSEEFVRLRGTQFSLHVHTVLMRRSLEQFRPNIIYAQRLIHEIRVARPDGEPPTQSSDLVNGIVPGDHHSPPVLGQEEQIAFSGGNGVPEYMLVAQRVEIVGPVLDVRLGRKDHGTRRSDL